MEGLDLLVLEQRKLLEMIATGLPLDDCLRALCRAVPKLSQGTRAAIMLADEACKTFPSSISPDLAPSFGEGLQGAPINDLAIGTCGEALFKGEQVRCRNIATEEKWSKQWRELCLSHGVMACISEPILAPEGKPLGSFMLCFDKPRDPTRWELRMMKFGTYIASIALTRDRTIRALHQSEERYLTLFQSIDAGFCVLEMQGNDETDADFRLLEANPMCEKLTGLKTPAGKSIREHLPGLDEEWLQMFARVALSGEPIRAEMAARDRWFQVYCYQVDKPEDRHVGVLLDEITARKRYERGLKFLASVSQVLAGSGSVDEMMRTVAASIGRFMNLSACSLAEINEAADQAVVEFEWHRDDVPSTVGVYPIADYFFSQEVQAAVHQGDLLVVQDAASDPRFVTDKFKALKVGSVVCAPVVRDGKWRFLLCVDHSEAHGWREDETELVQRLSYRIWTRLERARHEEALYESERKLRQIFEGAKDYAIFSVDPAGFFTSWSPGAERLFGFEEREVMGRQIELVFTPQDRVENVPRLELERAREDGVAENERWHQRKDGSRFYASGLTQPMLDRGGQLIGFTTICRDRTAHHQAREWLERELLDSQRLQAASARLVAEYDLPALLEETLNAAISITHAHMGTVHLVEGENDSALRLLTSSGFAPGILADFQQLRAQDETCCSQAIRAGERVVVPDFSQSYITRDPGPPSQLHATLISGGVRAAEWTPLISRPGRLLGMIATYWRNPHQPGERELRLLDLLARQAADLIERQQSETGLRDLSQSLERRVAQRTAELQEQTARLQSLAAELASAEQRERKRLAALLHDDLQQLLVAASMQLGLAIARTDEKGTHAVAQAAKWIDEARNAARDLTRQLRPPALYEDGLVTALHWLASEMRKRHNLEVRIEGYEPARTMSDDIKALLFECLRELLFNVTKYAGVTEASVTLKEDGGFLQIVVMDAGVGFDVNTVGTSRQSGGFGLFSIRERLFALGGEMVMVSAPGKGTRIVLRAPLSDVAIADGASRQTTLREQNLTDDEAKPDLARDPRIEVLVVDDHPMVREGIANILSSDQRLLVSGQACDGLEAISVVERHPPDVVLMDVNMPRMNGIEATREICRRWPQTRIIGLSVQDDPTTAKSICDAGAAAFISKSGASDSMIAAILNQVPSKALQGYPAPSVAGVFES